MTSVNQLYAKSKLSVMHQNIRGLAKKVDRLNDFLSANSPTLLILTEHGLSHENLINTRIQGYTLVTDYSREDQRLGGVAIYSKDSENTIMKAIDISHHCTQSIFEAAMVRTETSKSNFIHIMGIYRPPGESADAAVHAIGNILESISTKSSIILMGDVNIDKLKPTAENRKFEEELATYNIKRLPLPATRITSSTATSIDMIGTNLEGKFVEFAVFEAGLSDHTGQFCNVPLKTTKEEKQQITYKRNFCHNNLESLKALLLEEDWEDVYAALDANEAYSQFSRTVRQALDCACPTKKSRAKARSKPKVVHDQLTKNLKTEFLTALHKYQVTGDQTDKDTMALKKKNYDLSLRNLKLNATSQHIIEAQNKPRAIWQVINAERRNKTPQERNFEIQLQGKLETDPETIANHFNNFFTSIAEETLKSQPKPNSPILHDLQSNVLNFSSPFKFKHVSPKDVRDIIMSMKSKLSCGVDEIPAKVVKHCSQQLAAPLASIVNKSFIHSQFPSALKISKVYPQHKKGSFHEIKNYRPISLLSPFSKIIEKIVLSQLMSYLKQEKLLSKDQHGFLKGKSTSSALTSIVESLIDQLDNKMHASAILLDYSKAFDCLGHQKTVKKLAAVGIKDREGAWFSSYLEGRTQIVEIQQTHKGTSYNYKSKPQPITRGVPQGSVLGPILYILFTNDLPDIINTNRNAKCIMYADDTTLLLRNNSAQELHEDTISTIDKVITYCNQNDLALNASKTVCMHFSRRTEQLLPLPDISSEKEAKLLGLTLDTDLTWTGHINGLCKKLSSGVFIVRRIYWIGGLEVAKSAYYAMFDSHLRYGITVWGGTTESNLNRVLVLQKKAIRVLANLQPLDSCRDSFKSLEVLTVIALYVKCVILQTIELDLPRGETIHNYNTRYAADYSLPIHHTAQFQRKPSYIGRKLFNALPTTLKALRGKALSLGLHNWLKTRPLYSIQEYYDATRH